MTPYLINMCENLNDMVELSPGPDEFMQRCQNNAIIVASYITANYWIDIIFATCIGQIFLHDCFADLISIAIWRYRSQSWTINNEQIPYIK